MSEMDFQDSPVAPLSPPPPSPQEGNGLAIASLVLAIVSFVLCGPLCSVPAVILGHISLGKIRRGVMPQDSRGFAMAGTILGYVNLAIFIVSVTVFVAFVILSSGAGRVSPFVYQL